MKYTVKSFWIWLISLTLILIGNIGYCILKYWDIHNHIILYEASVVTFFEYILYVIIGAYLANVIYNVKELYNNICDESSIDKLREEFQLELTKIRIEFAKEEK